MFVEKRIKEAVEKHVRKHRTTNPDKMIKNMKNVDFAYEPLTDNLNGYYLFISIKQQIMRVDETLDEYEKQVALFHEIGHCILEHKGKILLNSKTSVNYCKEEYEADLVAAYFFILHNGINRENINDFTVPERVKKLMMRFIGMN